jgi:hypothetical protein
MCQLHKQLFAASTRLYSEAFAEIPAVADDLGHMFRYHAARAAAMAGCGQGKDADSGNEKENARLRRLALDWLRADLTARRQLAQKEPNQARQVLFEVVLRMQQEKDFAGVRDAESLAKIADPERKDWQQLWTEVDTLRRGAAEMMKRESR